MIKSADRGERKRFEAENEYNLAESDLSKTLSGLPENTV